MDFMEPEGSLPVHRSPSLVRTPSQTNLVHIFPPYFPKIHSNIILPPTPRSSELPLPFRFSDQVTKLTNVMEQIPS